MNKLKMLPLFLALLLVVGCGGPKSQSLPEENYVKDAVPLSAPLAPEVPTPQSPPAEEAKNEAQELLEPKTATHPVQEPVPQAVPAPASPLPPAGPISPEVALAALGQPVGYFETLDPTPVLWGPGPTSGEALPPAVTDLQRTYGDLGALFYVPESQEIYLSFDEGYELGYTESLLDTLKDKGVTAVFFVTYGYVQSRPDLVARMINEGHILGNHSTAHPVGGLPTLGPVAMAQDILTLHQYVEEHFGYEMTLLRPPEGTFSQQSLAVTHALGYGSVFWSFAYNDWNPDNQMETSKATATVVDSSHPGGIYLLHAVSHTNTKILGTVIDELRGKGYTLSSWADLVAQ